MKDLAPIVLFCYNRPWHTQQTLDALSKNDLAHDSNLYIYCDGPKSGIGIKALADIEETRNIVKNENRFKSITIIESESNKGLADSIIKGVTEIVNRFGKIIVLEDDIITSPGFLTYMNDALEVYKNEEKVMHVSGYMYPVKTKLPETFFIRPTSCWGWATWKRAWDSFEKDVEKQINGIETNKGWNEFTIDGSYPSFKNQLYLNKNGVLNTWAIFWQTSVFLKRGLSLHPYPSLVQNIGFDGSGINCDLNTNSPYVWNSIANEIEVNKIKLQVNKKVFYFLKQYFLKVNSMKEKLTLRDKFYLFRNTKVNQLKDLYRVVFHYKKMLINDITETKKTNQLEEIERYKDGVTIFQGKTINYIDYASYQSTLEELFNQKIYSFKTINETPLIIDCGANIGLSILFFKELYKDSKIIAFEADPKVFKCLCDNLSSFGFKDVELINKALWDTETDLTFYSEGADGGRVDEKTFGNGEMIKVKTTCLSSYMNQKIDFLKIDIEGAEYRVLKESEPYLESVENIFVEYHSFVDKPQYLNEILDILTKSGFRYYISSIGVRSVQPFINLNQSLGMDNQINIFGYRKL